MNIYVANLDTQLTSEELKNIFAPFGEVSSAEIAMDGFTDQSRGFGFVEMPDESAALKAIAELNNKQISDRPITVQTAKPKEQHKGSYRVGNGVMKEYRFRKN
jgi:RNA recognition motif-containing protein